MEGILTMQFDLQGVANFVDKMVSMFGLQYPCYVSWAESFGAGPRHGGLEVYFVFPYWHARNSQKRNSNDTLWWIKIRLRFLELARQGRAGLPDWPRYGDMHPCILRAGFLYTIALCISIDTIVLLGCELSLYIANELGFYVTGSFWFPRGIGLIDEVGSDFWSSQINSATPVSRLGCLCGTSTPVNSTRVFAHPVLEASGAAITGSKDALDEWMLRNVAKFAG